MEKKKSIAIFVDADNSPSKYFDLILSDLANHGAIHIRKAYGNWTETKLKGWTNILHEYAIQPIQQFDLTKGKNATDLAMTIDIMDTLYQREIDVFCLITSDCDFTPVAMRLINQGKEVFGYGESKTTDSFKNACTRFLILNKKLDNEKISKTSPNKLKQDTKLISMIRDAINFSSDEEGWAPLAPIGSFMANKSSLDFRSYGYSKLSDLIAAIDLFQIQKKDNSIKVKNNK